MASGDVVFRVTADEAKSLRAFQKLIEKEKEAARAARNLGNESRRGGKKAEQALARGAKQALGFVGALTGIGSAIGGVMVIVNQLKREYQHLVSQQQRAAIAQMGVGEARALALMNRPPGMSPKELDKLVESVATRKGYEMPRQRAWQLATGMLSGKGSLDKGRYEKAFRSAARLGSVAGEGLDVTSYGGAIADVMKQTGKGSRAAGGLLMQFGTQSRVVDPAKQAAALIKTMSAGPAFGYTREQAAELTAAVSQLSGDIEGQTSATSVNRLMQTLTKMRSKGVSAGGKRKVKLTKRGMAGLTELQDIFGTLSQDEQDTLLSNMQLGKAGARGALMQLIRRDTAATGALSAAQKGITAPGAGTAETWEGYFKAVAGGKQEPLRTGRRGIRSATETQKLRDIQGGMAGMLRGEIDEFLKSVPGISLTEIQLGKLVQEIESRGGTVDAVGAVRRRLESTQERMGYGYKYKRGTGKFIEKLPGGLEESKRFGLWGEKVWRRPSEGGTTYSPYLENPDYDPRQQKAFERLYEVLDRLEKRIATDPRVSNANAHVE